MKKIKLFKQNKSVNLLLILLGLTSTVLASLSSSPVPVGAAACQDEPTSTTGRASQTINIEEAGTYTVWSRMKAPDANPAEYTIYVDGQCFVVGQATLPTQTLTWVNYQNGETTQKVMVELSAGEHDLVMTAGSENLELDRVMLLSDACEPVGTGDNCQLDTQDPAVNLTSPETGSTVAGSVTLTSSVSDNDSIDYVEFYYDTTLIGSDSTAPYSYTWDTSAVSNGTYELTARAYDLSGNVASSTAVGVTVTNTAPPPPVDAAITSFIATPTSINHGGSSTLQWIVAQGTDCVIDQGVGSVVGSGLLEVIPEETTTYQLSCDGLDGGESDTMSTTVTVITDSEDDDDDGSDTPPAEDTAPEDDGGAPDSSVDTGADEELADTGADVAVYLVGGLSLIIAGLLITTHRGKRILGTRRA